MCTINTEKSFFVHQVRAPLHMCTCSPVEYMPVTAAGINEWNVRLAWLSEFLGVSQVISLSTTPRASSV